MSGVPHSIIRARASVEHFSLVREATDVSGIAVPEPPPLSPYIRGGGVSVEQSIVQVTNIAAVGDADIRVVLVTPMGDYIIGAGTVGPKLSVAALVPAIVPGEHVRVDLLSTSDPGVQVDVTSPWTDVDVVTRETIELGPEYVDLVVGKSGKIFVMPLIGALANAGPNLEVDLQLVDGPETFDLFDFIAPAGFFLITHFGPDVKPTQRLRGRAVTGSGSFVAYLLQRPEVG